MKTQADRRRQEAPFKVGDKVWLSTANLPLKVGTRKLAEKYTGPFLIKEKVAEEAWRLQLPANFKLHDVFHSSQLKGVLGEPRSRAPVVLDEAEEAEFEVQEVLAHRKVKGQDQYLIRWKGYTAYDDTWEPVPNLKNAQEALKKFKRKEKGPG